MKVFVLILTSSQLNLAKRCYKSILNQQSVSFKYDIGVVINTLNKDYETKCYDYFKSLNLKVYKTESNGYPGKGHNSLLKVFENEHEYDYCIMIDGDDLFYPYAFKQFEQIYIRKPKTDIVHLMINDNISCTEKDHMYAKLKGNFKLYSALNHQENWWKEKGINNPFKQPLQQCRTPSRILLISRNALKYIKYCEECKLYDDYLAWLLLVESQYNNKLNTIALSDPTIYCYNAINDDSATHNFKEFEYEQRIFNKTTKNLTVLQKNWNYYKDLPYLKLENKHFSLEDKIKFCNKHYVDFEIDEKIKLSLKYFTTGNYLEAIKYYKKLLQFGLLDPNIHIQLGICYYKLDKLTESINSFENALQVKKEDYTCFKNLAILYNELNNYKFTVKYLNKALKIKKEPLLVQLANKVKYNGIVFNPTQKKGFKDKDILVIYTGYSLPFNGSNYESKDVYGSEISAIKLAEQLSKKYKVFVFCPCKNEITHNDVSYYNYSKYESFQEQFQIDVMIVSRFIHFFCQYTNSARKTYIWVHDSRTHESWLNKKLTDYSRPLFNNILSSIDGVICVSDWHKEYFIKWNNISSEYYHKIHVISNGIDESNFKNDVSKIKNRFIYCSDTSRGLDVLLTIFPKIKHYIPDATLDIYFSKISDEQKQIINSLPYVKFHGKISQKQLALELQKSDVWLYPNTSHETYCCCAHEAMMAKCLVICRKFSGLITTVGSGGILLSGNPSTQEWQTKAINVVLKLLTNDKLKEEYQNKAKKFALGRSWDNILNEWLKIL